MEQNERLEVLGNSQIIDCSIVRNKLRDSFCGFNVP
jgi:hypothetical protein